MFNKNAYVTNELLSDVTPMTINWDNPPPSPPKQIFTGANADLLQAAHDMLDDCDVHSSYHQVAEFVIYALENKP